MKSFLAASIFLGAVGASSLAFADEAGASSDAGVDTVYLRSGGLLRGRATEIVPGDHVTVQEAGGETKRISWPEIDRVVVASTPIPPPPATSVPAATPTASAPMTGPTTHVHLTSVNRSFLYRRAASGGDFVLACESPCGVELPLGDSYTIGGTGIATTKEFRLNGQPGGMLDLAVDGPNWFGIVGGGTLVLTGGVTAYVGAILGIAGGAGSTECGSTCNHSRNDRSVGLEMLAVGAAAVVGGLLIVYPSLKTDVSQASFENVHKDAFVRAPIWRAGLEQSAPTATFPPLFSQSF